MSLHDVLTAACVFALGSAFGWFVVEPLIIKPVVRYLKGDRDGDA